MGSIIDLKKVDEIYRCKDVKEIIIYINLIGAPISLIFLLFCILRMILAKHKKTFLTNLILLIFSSEVVNDISKLLQLIKYCFLDKRDERDFNCHDTPRGIICQIQIAISMYSDFCSLLGTLLLSLRCYDIIINRNSFFNKGKNAMFSIIFIIAISVALSIIILIIDREVLDAKLAYRYDIRDRCSYWCWLRHETSIICFILYWIILIFNIVFACKTNTSLKNGYNKLIGKSIITNENNNDMNTPLNEISKEIIVTKDGTSLLTNTEKKRLKEFKIMRIKCLIYPYVTIIIWLIIATYRIVDDSLFYEIDQYDDSQKSIDKEKEILGDNIFLNNIVEIFLVFHTFLSTLRGIFYGLSFIIFEEKIFFNFFKKFYKKCLKDEYSEENEDDVHEIQRNTNNFSVENDYENKEKEEKEEENYSKNDIELNTSEYQYDENI
jgi:hypothetical protein